MSKLKDLSLWNSAITSFEQGNHSDALNELSEISEQSSRIRWNIGAVHQKMGHLDKAIQAYTKTIEHDDHNALAFYQRACIHHQRNNYTGALEDFTQAQTLLRGRSVIDYTQLGLRHKLYACDVLHNQGVCHLLLGDFTRGMDMLLKSKDCKVEARHSHIEDTLTVVNNSRGNSTNLSLILVSSDAIFKPPREKINHMKSINYLGKPKLVTTQNEGDKFTGFSGKQLLDVARRQPMSRSAPVSPGTTSPHSASPEGRSAQGSEPATLVSQLHRALSPDRDTRPRVLKPGMAQKEKSKTPPAKWSPAAVATAKQAAIPPPPNRSLPPPPNRPMPKPPQNIPSISVNSTELDKIKGQDTEKHQHELSDILAKRLQTSVVAPPPPLPDRAPREQSSSSMVTVVMVCASHREVTIPNKAPLATVLEQAAKTFQLIPKEFDVWSKDSSEEYFMIRDNRKMQRVWERCSGDDILMLWIFAKT